MLPIRNISYLLPMCWSFWEKCIYSQKTGLGCSTPLIDIIEDCNLHVKTSLPVALLRVDKNLSQVTAPGSIKRACLNRVKYGQELHERMDMLYTSSEDEIGPFFTKMGIIKQEVVTRSSPIWSWTWYDCHKWWHPWTIPVHKEHWWSELGRWCAMLIARFYPDEEHELPVPKVWQSEWKRLQAKRNSKKYAAKKTLRDEWLMEEYQLSNRATPAASVDNIVTEDDPGLKDDGVDMRQQV